MALIRSALAPTALALALAAPAAATPLDSADTDTATPIKHVIIVIGENRTFDHLFGLWRPRSGASVRNLLSEAILKADGSPGPNFARAAQAQARVTQHYENAPAAKQLYAVLPPAMTDDAPSAPSDKFPPFTTAELAARFGGALLPQDRRLLLTGATGLKTRVVDTRVPNADHLPNGPYRLSPAVPYDSYTADPTHRFFQMWQQEDCAVAHATRENPSGCLADLFPWVEVSVGPGSNGKPIAPGFDDRTIGEGAAAMAVYDAAAGDAAYFTHLADTYASSDNYHQAVMGGTGANHIALGTGDAIWYSDGAGHPAKPPDSQIENPDPQPGTNNFYVQDGYGGGSYVNCADETAPGVKPILDYLAALPQKPKPNCEPGHWYIVNNYSPGYLGDGTVNTAGKFVVPPSSIRTIGDALEEKHISFRYYGESWDRYVQDPSDRLYCTICNFLQYTTSIMTDAKARAEHIKDVPDLYNDIDDDALPAVSWVKPNSLNDGHPRASKMTLLEAFLRKLLGRIEARPALFRETAVFITVDEGGGYWDSGYVQPLDFFGDGTRIPLIVVSPLSRGGKVSHAYADHVSTLKFIERNWRLAPLTARSRDNLPNPVAARDNPYVPTNGPAISDLFDLFAFRAK